MNEIIEMIYQWHQGKSVKGIERSFGIDRKTVRKYVRLAQSIGVCRDRAFPLETELVSQLGDLSHSRLLREKPARDLIASHREWVEEKLKVPGITAKQIWRLFREERGIRVSYCTMKRYLKAEFQFGAPLVTVRMEVEPGSQAQVDFGYAGMMVDPLSGKLRRAWAFIMTLSYSRHRFVRFIFRQDVRNWIDCHIRAFEFFGGVPASVVLDNLKAGVVKADIYDPTLNRAYAELERHYGFVADPAKAGEPKHKGKVERGVPVVRKHLLAGRSFRDIEEANQRALRWCREEIGMESHGTTKKKPFEVFQREEAPRLRSLPSEPFECPEWKRCTVHPDHHIVFDKSYYSLPTRWIGKEVWVRGTRRLVQLFSDEQLIKTHLRAEQPGTWVTDFSDYPPEKLAYLMVTPTYCLKKASEIGPHTGALMEEILREHAMRNLRKAQGLLRLAEKHGSSSMEAAAKRALFFSNFRYRSIKTILEKGWFSLEQTTPSASAAQIPLSPLGQRFLRPPEYFAQREEVIS
ncbi:MAG: IS21 family transposase [Thermodesulfobacteriota bacterium]